MKEYNIGDQVYVAYCGTSKVRVKCPVCFGKCKITVILGNDDHVNIACNYCSPGYSQPSGYVEDTVFSSDVHLVTIESKNTYLKDGSCDIQYGYSNYILYVDLMFDSKEEAEAHATKLANIKQEERIKQKEYGKDNTVKSVGWHIGYYQRLQKNALKDIKLYSEKIEYFKNEKKLAKL